MSTGRENAKAIRLDALLGAPGTGALKVSGLTADSRTAGPGYLFAALPGTRDDGASHIPEAVQRGAVAVLVRKGTRVAERIAVVEDICPRRRFAEMVARFYDRQPDLMAAVTGTNGKTSVASFARQLWCALGIEGASIGTLGVESRPFTRPGGLTSPDPVTLHAALASLAARGVSHAVCEASSHGLAQYRLDGIRFHAAAFTNLTRDHLDYHGTFEAYFHAKARLFADLLDDAGTAVINVDDEFGRRMATLAHGGGHGLLSVGRSEDAQLRLRGCDAIGEGQRLEIAFNGKSHVVDFPLPGRFQAENALLAAGLVIACGAEGAHVLPLLSALEPVPGRLEKVGTSKGGGTIYIDYAHTPDGLGKALEALRPHTPGELVVVFGCGGDRDRGKRPEMGAIATACADRVIVTDDNPRSEDPAAIRREILVAAPQAGEIGDRRAAIVTAIETLSQGDTLLIAGKGHEEGQIIGDRVLPFSDIAVVQAAIEGRKI